MKKINKQRLQQLAGIPLREQEQYKSAMEVTITISRQLLKLIVMYLKEEYDFKTSVASLATSPTFQRWLVSDAEDRWLEEFKFESGLVDSLDSLDLSKIRGIKVKR